MDNGAERKRNNFEAMNKIESVADTNVVVVDYRTGLARLSAFIFSNVGLAITFCLLWIWQYRINFKLSDDIDLIVVPWLWLAGFFTASFLSIRRSVSRPIVVSIFSAIAFSLFLWLTTHIILAPFFDPMF